MSLLSSFSSLVASSSPTINLYSWFVKSPISSGLGVWQLALGLFVLAWVLGYCIFTDLHGKVISNRVTVPLIVAGLASGPLLYDSRQVKHMLIVAVITFVLLFALNLTGGFGAGDVKLLVGLVFFFAKAIIGIFFLGEVIAFAYAIPVMIIAKRRKGRGEFEGKIRKIKLQFGPAIALATVVPVWASGAHHWALLYLGVMLLSLIFYELDIPGRLSKEEPEALAAALADESGAVELETELETDAEPSVG